MREIEDPRVAAGAHARGGPARRHPAGLTQANLSRVPAARGRRNSRECGKQAVNDVRKLAGCSGFHAGGGRLNSLGKWRAKAGAWRAAGGGSAPPPRLRVASSRCGHAGSASALLRHRGGPWRPNQSSRTRRRRRCRRSRTRSAWRPGPAGAAGAEAPEPRLPDIADASARRRSARAAPAGSDEGGRPDRCPRARRPAALRALAAASSPRTGRPSPTTIAATSASCCRPCSDAPPGAPTSSRRLPR